MDDSQVWAEYDSAAEWCAKNKIKDTHGADIRFLPPNISRECYFLIEGDPEAFEARISATAYAIAMEGVSPDE